MYMQVQNDNVKAIQFAQFISCSCDEVTILTVSLGFLCMHVWLIDQLKHIYYGLY